MHETPDARPPFTPADAPASPSLPPNADVMGSPDAHDSAGQSMFAHSRPTPRPMPTDEIPTAPLYAVRATPPLRAPAAGGASPWDRPLTPPRPFSARPLPAARPRSTSTSRRAFWLAALAAMLAVVALAGPSNADLYAGVAAARASFRYDRALTFAAEAARMDPDNPHPHCLMGEVLQLQQRYARATAELMRCVRLGDNSSDVWLSLGDVARAAGDPSDAEHAWQRSVALGGTTARRRLALLYESAGRFDEAQAQWRALGSGDGEAQAHLGLLALRQGDYDTARAAFVAARGLPGSFGQDMVTQGFVTLAAFAPTDAPGLASIGAAFIRAGMNTFARLPLEHAVALDPTNGHAHAYLAWVDWLAGEPSAATTEITSARQLIPTDSFTLFIAAELEMASGQRHAAASDLATAIQHDGKNPALWSAQAQIDLERRDYVAADLSYTMAAQLASDPSFTIALLRFYVDHRYGMGNDRARIAATRAITAWPYNEPIQVLAAQIFDLSNQPVLAYEAYQQANQLDPSDPVPYLALGRVALAGEDYDTAARDLRTVMALRPDSDEARQASQLIAPIANLDL